MTRHLKTHENKDNYPCPQCDSEFTNRSYLDNHLQKFHNTKKTFNCTECDNEFTNQYKLDRHFKKHTKTPSIVCAICKMEFSRTTPLK